MNALDVFYWIALFVAVGFGGGVSFGPGGNRFYGIGWIGLLVMGVCIGIRSFPISLH